MLRFVTGFLLVDIFVSVSVLTKGLKPRSVNLALETVLAFDHKDKSSNIKFLDDVQTFISKIRQAVDSKTPYRRSFNNEENKIPARRSFNNADNKIPAGSFNNADNKIPDGRSFNNAENKTPARRSLNNVENKTPAIRNLNNADNAGSIKFIDFLIKLIHTLKGYEDNDLEDVFAVIDDEIRKYHYKGCKFYELVQNNKIRKFIADCLKHVKGKTGAEIRAKLDKLQQVTDYAKYNIKQSEILDYMNSLYTKYDGEDLNHILNNLEKYRSKYKRSNTNLVHLVRKGIRTAIFDHYSKLNENTRRDFKLKIETFWQQMDKAEKEDHRMWNIEYQNTDNPNEKRLHFSDKDNMDEKNTNEEENVDSNEGEKTQKKVHQKHNKSDSNAMVIDETDRGVESGKNAKGPVKSERVGDKVMDENSMGTETEEQSTDIKEQTDKTITNEKEVAEYGTTDEHSGVIEIDDTEKNKPRTKKAPKGATNLFINLQSSEYATPLKSWYIDDEKSKKKHKHIKKQMSSFVTLYPEEITLTILQKKRFKIEYTTMKSTETMHTLWQEKIKTKPKSKKQKHRPKEKIDVLTNELNAEVSVEVTGSPHFYKSKIKDLAKQSSNKTSFKNNKVKYKETDIKNSSVSSGSNGKTYKNIKMKAEKEDESEDTQTRVHPSYEDVGLKLILTPPKRSRHYPKTHKNKRDIKRRAKKKSSLEFSSFKGEKKEERHFEEQAKTIKMNKTVIKPTQQDSGTSIRNKRTKENPLQESNNDESETIPQHEIVEEKVLQKSTEDKLGMPIQDKTAEEKTSQKSMDEKSEIATKHTKVTEKTEQDITEEEIKTTISHKIEEKSEEKSTEEEELETTIPPNITAKEESVKKSREKGLENTPSHIITEEKKLPNSTEELDTTRPDLTEEKSSQDLKHVILKSSTTSRVNTTKREFTEKYLSEEKVNESGSKEKKVTKNYEDLPSGELGGPKDKKAKSSTNYTMSNITRNINMRAKKKQYKKHRSKHRRPKSSGISQSYETKASKRFNRKSNDLRRDEKTDDKFNTTDSVTTPVDKNKNATQTRFKADSKHPERINYWEGTTKNISNSTTTTITPLTNTTTEHNANTTIEVITTSMPKTTVVNTSKVTSKVNITEKTTATTKATTNVLNKVTISKDAIMSANKSEVSVETVTPEASKDSPWMRHQPNKTVGRFDFPETFPRDLRADYHHNEINNDIEDNEMKKLFAKYGVTPRDPGFGNHTGFLQGLGPQDVDTKLLTHLNPGDKHPDGMMQERIDMDLAKLMAGDIHVPGRDNNMTNSGRRSLYDGLEELGPEFDNMF